MAFRTGDISRGDVVYKDPSEGTYGNELQVGSSDAKVENERTSKTACINRSEILILDANAMIKISLAPLPHHIPYSFHCVFELY